MGAPITSSNFAKALWPGINSWYGKSYNEFPTEYTELFDTFGSQRAYEEDVGVTSFGLAQVKPEGQAIANDEESQAYTNRYTHVTYGLGFVITREIFEDDLYDVVGQRRAMGLAFSMRQTKEVVGANVYNNAFDAGFVGGDGVSMINAAHPNFAGGTQSNQITGDPPLTEAGLESAIIQMTKWTNDRGLRINIQPRSLVIPVEQQFNAVRVLQSPMQTGIAPGATTPVGGLHEVSAIYQMGILPGGFTVNHYLTDANAWFLRSTLQQDGLKHFERRADEFGVDNDFPTENAMYKATGRYSFGWTDWRAIAGSQGA